MVLRTNNEIDAEELEHAAHLIHDKSQKVPVNVVVRQNSNDLNSLHVECCRADKCGKTLQGLEEEGYTWV